MTRLARAVVVATLDGRGRGVCVERINPSLAPDYAARLAATLPKGWRVETHPPGPRLRRRALGVWRADDAAPDPRPSGLVLAVKAGPGEPEEKVRPRGGSPRGLARRARSICLSLPPGGEVVLWQGHEPLFWAVSVGPGRIEEKNILTVVALDRILVLSARR